VCGWGKKAHIQQGWKSRGPGVPPSPHFDVRGLNTYNEQKTSLKEQNYTVYLEEQGLNPINSRL